MQSCTVGPNKQLWVVYVQSFCSDTQVPKQRRKEKKEAEAMPVFWWDTAGFLRHAGTETSAISTTCGHPLLTHGMPFHNSQFYVSCMCVCCFPCNCCLAMYHKLLYMHAVAIRNLCYFCQHREHELLIYHIYHGLLVSTTTQFTMISEWKVFWSFWSFHCRLFISVSRYTSFSNFMSDSALLLHIR